MKPQPDTSTLEGKIAVMEASKTCRIQWCSKNILGKLWIDCEKPLWEWDTFQYRIHPDDLNPQEKPTYRPWYSNEVPVGRIVVSKNCESKFVIMGVLKSYIFIGPGESTSASDILKKYVMEDGSPCGVKL